MKKIISIGLALILVIGMTMVATAADKSIVTPTIYTIQNEGVFEGVYGDYQDDAAWWPEDTHPGSVITVPLLRRGFRDDFGGEIMDWGVANHPEYGPNVRQLKVNRVVPHILDARQYKYIDSIKLVDYTPTTRNPAQAAVEIRFTEDFVSTTDLQYEFTIYLSLGDRSTPTKETFKGRLSNEIFDVYNLDYLYIGDGQVAYAETGTKMNLELDLGNDVKMFRNMYKGERYYGKATVNPNEGQDPVARAYREIVTVIDIKSVDMKLNGDIVELQKGLRSDVYFVYNLEGDFVGMSNVRLPYSTRYYLSATDIQIDPVLAQRAAEPTGEAAKLSDALTNFIEGGTAAQLEEQQEPELN